MGRRNESAKLRVARCAQTSHNYFARHSPVRPEVGPYLALRACAASRSLCATICNDRMLNDNKTHFHIFQSHPALRARAPGRKLLFLIVHETSENHKWRIKIFAKPMIFTLACHVCCERECQYGGARSPSEPCLANVLRQLGASRSNAATHSRGGLGETAPPYWHAA